MHKRVLTDGHILQVYFRPPPFWWVTTWCASVIFVALIGCGTISMGVVAELPVGETLLAVLAVLCDRGVPPPCCWYMPEPSSMAPVQNAWSVSPSLLSRTPSIPRTSIIFTSPPPPARGRRFVGVIFIRLITHLLPGARCKQKHRKK